MPCPDAVTPAELFSFRLFDSLAPAREVFEYIDNKDWKALYATFSDYDVRRAPRPLPAALSPRDPSEGNPPARKRTASGFRPEDFRPRRNASAKNAGLEIPRLGTRRSWPRGPTREGEGTGTRGQGCSYLTACGKSVRQNPCSAKR